MCVNECIHMCVCVHVFACKCICVSHCFGNSCYVYHLWEIQIKLSVSVLSSLTNIVFSHRISHSDFCHTQSIYSVHVHLVTLIYLCSWRHSAVWGLSIVKTTFKQKHMKQEQACIDCSYVEAIVDTTTD